MATPLNKSSAYVQSLVDFILDTKPYHSKLTEVVEEYQFADDVKVKITETSFIRTMHKAAWVYNFFSSGNPALSSFQVKRVTSPDFNGLEHNSDPTHDAGRWKAGRDENTDMALVPLVFSKKQFDGVGVADAWIEVGGTGVLPYVEGHDFFQSHGSLEFQIRQIYDPLLQLKPLWAETRTNGIIGTATANTMALEQDLARPQAAINKLITLTTSIQSWLNFNPSAAPGWTLAVNACASLLATLATGTIPPAYTTSPGNPDMVLAGDYSTIIEGATAAGTPPPYGFAGWIGEDTTVNKYVDEAFSALLPPLLFGMHSDIGLYETGSIEYDDTAGLTMIVTNITANPGTAYEEWTLTAIVPGPATWQVTGSQSGFIGIVTAGTTFTSTQISFSTIQTGVPLIGEKIVLTARNQISVHPSAPLETWNIIKVNPRTYTRPVFTSTNYGYITDLSAVIGSVTLLDITMTPGTYVIALISAMTFSITCSADPLYSGSGFVNTTFNDGKLGFTLLNGSSQPFQAGDYFLVEVANGPAVPANFDLFYGYDLDSYDNPDLVYENVDGGDPDYGRSLDFRFDSRFNDYDVANMNLVVTQAAIDGRSFRLMAVPDGAPIETLKQDGTTFSNSVDLIAEAFEIPPVTVTGNPPVFSLPGDPNPAPDIQLYYAGNFRLEYSDDGFTTSTVVGLVPVGGAYSNPALGISFTLPIGSKPFIAASCDDGLANPRVEGGDVFFFTVFNPPPMLAVQPVGLTGATAPRLIMHGDSYYASVPASWTIAFSSSTAYTLNGLYNSGPLSGTQVPGYPVSGTLSLNSANPIANYSYKDDNVHFTIVTGRGVAGSDSFNFQTHEPRPTFLVHGSVSGWQPDAEYDRWYFNGKIGFKIKSPVVEAYEPGVWPIRRPEALGYHAFPTGYVKIDYLRPDCPSLRYIFTRNTNGFIVRRTDLDVQGFCPHNGTYQDQYVTMEVADPTNDFQISIIPSSFDFWNAQDAVIVRSNYSIMNPTANDYVVIKKTEDGTLGVNLDYANLLIAPDLTPLAPVSIDARFIDTTTGYGTIPLTVTSPEVALVTGWIPTFTKKKDTTTSIAQFPDVADIFELYSAASGQLVGTLQPQTTPFSEPTIFKFDPTFFATYLPLNAQANVLTYGTGMDENVRVLISERLNILESGSAIFENALFADLINVTITEADTKYITTYPALTVGVGVSDAFGDFLPGYDTSGYDNEAISGFYSIGTPLTGLFTEGQQLSGILPMNPVQLSLSPAQLAARLALISQLLDGYLTGGSIATTTLPQFLAAIDADGAINYTPVAGAFGLPASGLGIDIDEKATETTGAAIQEAFSVQVLDMSDTFDEFGFDTDGFDAYGGRTALLFAMGLPPVGTNGIDYSTTITPLEVAGFNVGAFDVTFSNPPLNMATPYFQIWRPADVAPQPVGVVQVISNGRFRFTVPVPTEAKVVVS